MTDANILERLSATDSFEVAMAQVARRRSTDTAVVAYADQLLADHSMSLQRDRLIALRPNLAVQMMPGDTSALVQFRALDSLTVSTPAAVFDRRFLTAQIQMHAHWLAVLHTLQRVAHDKALNEHVAASIPTVTRHLTRARQLASVARAVDGG
jgi:predicted outer membrane protein